ncbi:MAG: extracellular solute-binding protein [Oscillospiraceae bacterium]
MKKALSLLLAITLACSLAACGAQPAPSSSVASAPEVPQNTDPLGKYEEPVKLTTVRSMVAGYTYPEGDDIYDNPYTRATQEELNVSVDCEWVVDASQYNTKLSTMLASGDLPDYFSCDASTMYELAEENLIYDIGEVYNTFAGEELRSYCDGFKEGFDSAKIDGKLYGMPNLGFGTISLPNILWIRSDWLEKYDLQAPKSMDDLVNIAKTFRDKEGANGFAIEKGMFDGLDNVVSYFNAYHAYPRIWIEKDGKIEYGSVQPETREALLFLQNMYKDGLIDKEFGAKDVNKVNEDLVNGKVGIMSGLNWACFWPLTDSLKANPDARWKPYAVPSVDDKPVKLQANWPVDSYIVINKDCKNPEAIIKMLNQFIKVTAEMRFPAEKYNGLDWQAGYISYPNPIREYEHHVLLAEALETRDTSALAVAPSLQTNYDACLTWLNEQNPEGFGVYYQRSKEGSFGVIKEYIDSDNILLTALKGSDPTGYANIKSTLLTMEMEAFTKIIMGAPIEDFDKFVENWEKLGGTAATEEINAIYNK